MQTVSWNSRLILQVQNKQYRSLSQRAAGHSDEADGGTQAERVRQVQLVHCDTICSFNLSPCSETQAPLKHLSASTEAMLLECVEKELVEMSATKRTTDKCPSCELSTDIFMPVIEVGMKNPKIPLTSEGFCLKSQEATMIKQNATASASPRHVWSCEEVHLAIRQ